MTRLHIGHRQRLALGAAALLGIGAAGGAGAVALTRPAVEMAPANATPIAKLPASSGIVTVKGRIAEVFGDRIVVQDGSGRAMVDAGRDAASRLSRGAAVTVQGRYDDGQLRARFLVDPAGRVEEVGPGRPPHGPGGPHGGPRDGRPDAPPPPPAGDDAPPPPATGPAPAAASPTLQTPGTGAPATTR